MEEQHTVIDINHYFMALKDSLVDRHTSVLDTDTFIAGIGTSGVDIGTLVAGIDTSGVGRDTSMVDIDTLVGDINTLVVDIDIPVAGIGTSVVDTGEEVIEAVIIVDHLANEILLNRKRSRN